MALASRLLCSAIGRHHHRSRRWLQQSTAGPFFARTGREHFPHLHQDHLLDVHRQIRDLPHIEHIWRPIMRSDSVTESEARKLMGHWSQAQPTLLNMGFWTAWSRRTEETKEATESESCRFLLRELPVRISHTMQGLDALHPAIQTSDSYRSLFLNYCQSICEIQDFTRAITDLGSIDEFHVAFRRMLSQIHNRHSSMVMKLSSALLEWKENDPCLFAENQLLLNSLLDRIFLIRIGVRVLISQHILLFSDPEEAKAVPRQWIGLIDSECQPSVVARQAAEDARFLAQQSFIDVPEVRIVGSRDSLETKFPYISSHLHHIVFELTKNALRATIENNSDAFESNSAVPRITIVLAKGDADLTIKISDLGGGISRPNISRIFDYSFTTASRPDHAEPADLAHAPLAGFGYGLPLSRQYARYLGGDVQVISMDGYGVDAFVYLKLIASNTVEVFPDSI